MNEQMETLLRELAEQLGTTSEYLWQVLVAGQQAAALYHGFLFVALAACGTGCVKLATMARRAEDEVARDLGAVLFGMASATFFGFAIANAASMLTPLFYPEYAALHELLGILGR